MPVRLTLLGGFGTILDGVEQDWIPAKKLRAALLTYIAMERRASRETLTAFFWPESDEDRSRHALRQTLYTLREGLGEDWVKSGPLEIRATANLGSDAADFDAALGRGDPAGAASLYRGPFLGGVHLLSNHAWEEWVDARRAHYEGAFRKACRDWVDQRVAAGDPAGALTAARRWAAPDPLDDEAQHTLIELLAATGQRAEAVRQYEHYQRLLEAEELEPLDETRALVDKLRHARSLPAPSRRSAMEAEEAPPTPTRLHTLVPATDTGPVATPPHVELAHEPHHHRGPRRWAAAVLVLAALTILALLWPRAGTLPLSRASSAPPDTSTYAVLPVTAEGLSASRWNPTQLIHDAVAGWSGITVVDHFRVREAVEQEPSAVLSLTDARRMAAGLGAGRFLFGEVHPQGDSAALSVALYESGSGRLVREAMVVVAASGAGAAEGVERLTEALLLGDPLRIHAAAHRGTRSVPAAAAMARGMDAVWDWELGEAAEAFRIAVDHDPVYAQGWLWLGLVESWTQPRAPARWVGNAQRALAAGEALSAHDQDIAAALAAQGRGEFPAACARWRSLAARDSLNFVPWYGLGTCLRSDDVVQRDLKSRSGWGFRASHGETVGAFRNAMALLPAAHAQLTSDGFDPSRPFLFLSSLQLRLGRAEAPDTTTFMAYAAWDDSLAFFPTPAWDHAAFARTSDHAATTRAVLKQRETFLELANGWSASRPASASALEALALALELLENPTALDSLRRARSLVGDEEERLRVGASEFWLRLKRALPRDTAGLRHARALSDTLLREGRRAGSLSSTLAGRLASIAAMRGRTAEAAALARVAMGEVVPGPLAHSAPGLLTFSALGGPVDSIHALTEQVAAVFENPESAPPGQAVWLGRPATLAFPDHRVDLHAGGGEAAEFDLRYRAVAAYWRGDRAEALRLLESIFAERTLLHIAPEAVTIDAAYTEAALLERLRGTAEARTFLRRAIDGARTLPSGSYDVAQAGTLMRAMAFMAELEVRGGDPRMGRDWARAVAILCVGADPHFRAGLERRTTLAMDGH